MFGASHRLLNRDHDSVYFRGMPEDGDGRRLRRHGDGLARLGGGYWRATGRTDDAMNLGGIKTSALELEAAVAGAHPRVAEVAAVAVAPPGGGPSALWLVAASAQAGVPDGAAARRLEAELRGTFQRALSAKLNPLFRVRGVLLCPALPRTASGKVLRRKLREECQRRSLEPPRGPAASKL